MSHKLHAADPTAPLKSIRRFDVFAEVNRLKALDEGQARRRSQGLRDLAGQSGGLATVRAEGRSGRSRGWIGQVARRGRNARRSRGSRRSVASCRPTRRSILRSSIGWAADSTTRCSHRRSRRPSSPARSTRIFATRSGRTGKPAGKCDGGEQNSPPSMLVLSETALFATSSGYRAILKAVGVSSARSWRRCGQPAIQLPDLTIE